MKKLKAVLLFGAIGFILAIASSTIGFFLEDNSCSGANAAPTCELGPPGTKFGLPFNYLDNYDIGYPIAFEPNNIVELYNRTFITQGAIYWPGLIGDTIFWGSISWLVYWLWQRNHIKKSKL